MKTLFTVLLVLLFLASNAQIVDSTAIRQVDSLIQVSQTLSKKRDFDQALDINVMAEKIALEKIGMFLAYSIFPDRGCWPV